MANGEHLAILKQGVEAWNKWRNKNLGARPDLSETDLHWVDLHGANLRGADLNETDLRAAHIHGADLRDASLIGACLNKTTLRAAYLNWADLRMADLRMADLSLANLSLANLSQANLSQANLSETNLSGATLIGTNMEGATLSGCRIYGISAWDMKLTAAKQSDLIITEEDQPIITVDNLEVAQFIYLLLNNERIRDVINTITTKVVLILGRFTPERKAILDTIREALRRDGRYIPVLFDFAKPPTRDTHETITTLARLARFVIADITDPKSIPQELVSIVEQMPSLPVQPLLQSGCEPWGMYDHIRKYPWVLELCHYDNLAELLTHLGPKVVEPAEAKAKELTAR